MLACQVGLSGMLPGYLDTPAFHSLWWWGGGGLLLRTLITVGSIPASTQSLLLSLTALSFLGELLPPSQHPPGGSCLVETERQDPGKRKSSAY